MKRQFIAAAWILAAFFMASCAGARSGAGPVPAVPGGSHSVETVTVAAPTAHPDNRPSEDFDELWGTKVDDPYRWLEDAGDPAVREWMSRQDTRARDYLHAMPSRPSFVERLEKLLYVPSISTPTEAGGKLFYVARDARAEKGIYYVKENVPGAEQRILLDPNGLSDDGSVSVGTTSVSPDGRLMTYKLKKNNADASTLYIMDTDTGEQLPDVIEGARYAYPAWLPDNSGFYYTWFPTDDSIPVDQRPGLTEIRFHRIGTPAAGDEVVMGPLNDPTKFHSLVLSDDGEWQIYTVEDGWNGNSLRIRRRGTDKWIELDARKDTIYDATIHRGRLYLRTNDSAPHFRLVAVDLDGASSIGPDAWKEIIPESADSVMEWAGIVRDRIVAGTIRDVVNHLDVYDLDGRHLKEVPLPDRGSIVGYSGQREDGSIYFSFTSFKTPREIYRMDVDSLEVSLWDRVGSLADLDNTVVDQVFATSRDGTRIPFFVIRRRDTPLDGTAKAIVYGYGGCSVSILPTYGPTSHAWVENGGIYVLSILRGGAEYGESWHRDGMRMNKQNVFDDYYAVAEKLIADGYSSAGRIAAYGGSNGGLLVGAALTQRPDLYGAVVCAVPLLDMVRFHKFGSGRTWTSEYMSVEESEEAFRTILAYSPYSNVHRGTMYPPVLFLSADSDDRVDPMHARKMTASIQDATSGTGPVLLRIEKNSGHGGADKLTSWIEEMADVYSFLDYVLGRGTY